MQALVFSGTGGHAQVVQSTGSEHDFINHPLPPIAERVGDDAASFHPGDGVLHAGSDFADDLVDGFLPRVEFTAAGFLPGLERADAGRLIALEAGVLEQERVGRKAKPALVRELLVICTLPEEVGLR